MQRRSDRRGGVVGIGKGHADSARNRLSCTSRAGRNNNMVPVKWGPEEEANEKYHLSQPPGGDNPSSVNQPIQQPRLNVQRASQLVMDFIIYQPHI